MDDDTSESRNSEHETQNSKHTTRTPEGDVWEEEIDLRELGRNVLAKWYVWILLPIAVMLATGVYYYRQPDQYRLSAVVTMNVDPSVAGSLGMDSLTAESLGNVISSHLKVETNVRRNRTAETLKYEVTSTTTRPDEVQSSLAQNFDAIVPEFLNTVRKETAGLEKTLENNIDSLNQHIRAWKNLSAVERSAGLAPFANEFLQLRKKLTFLKQLSSGPEELITHNLDQLEITAAGPQRIRNILLSGAVTFLLALFGITFWEIL